MFEWIYNSESWITLATLIFLEIILGIDNLVFISITIIKLPIHQQNTARVLGLTLAMFTRILLLFSIAWIITLTNPLIGKFSGKDIFLFCGGVFLAYKGISEIFTLHIHAYQSQDTSQKKQKNFILCLIEIAILDIVFSLDSIITAVGMIQSLHISHQSMLILATIAIIITVLVMLFISGTISDFINHHPSIKLLALCFLVLIGGVLIADSLGYHIPKSYVYAILIFSLIVELIKIYKEKKSQDL